MPKLWKDWSRAEFLKLPYPTEPVLKLSELFFFTPGTKHDSGYGDIALFGSREGGIPEFRLGSCDNLNISPYAFSERMQLCADDIHIDANNRGVFRIWLRPNKEFVINKVGSSRWLTLQEKTK